MIRTLIGKVMGGESLDEAEAGQAMNLIMEGRATPSQIAALLVALRMKGESVAEITGFARSMREKALRVPCRCSGDDLVDTCGTGGDGLNTFNISTAAALVAAGAGARVAKHGNRAMSSRCGSADVLEALGVNLALDPEQVGRCVELVGIGFLFAPALHPAMKHAGPVRRELGTRTVFNLLGPLTNPAGARCQVLGVYDPNLAGLLARVLLRLGSRRAMVFHGLDGMDEISTCASTRVAEVRDGEVHEYLISPEQLGLDSPSPQALAGGTPPENAARLLALLAGEMGALRDIVCLNAAAALVVGGLAPDLAQGLILARQALDSGAAAQKLEQLKEFSHVSG